MEISLYLLYLTDLFIIVDYRPSFSSRNDFPTTLFISKAYAVLNYCEFSRLFLRRHLYWLKDIKCNAFEFQTQSNHSKLQMEQMIDLPWWIHLIAFLCNAKIFAIAITSLSLFSCTVFLDGLAKVILIFFPFVALSACNQDRRYKYDMPCAFKPYSWEKSRNGRLEWEHLESSSGT